MNIYDKIRNYDYWSDVKVIDRPKKPKLPAISTKANTAMARPRQLPGRSRNWNGPRADIG